MTLHCNRTRGDVRKGINSVMEAERVSFRVERTRPDESTPENIALVVEALQENVAEIKDCTEIYLKQLDDSKPLDFYTKSWVLSINKFIDVCILCCSEENKEVFGHNLRAIYEYAVRMMYYHHSGDVERSLHQIGTRQRRT